MKLAGRFDARAQIAGEELNAKQFPDLTPPRFDRDSMNTFVESRWPQPALRLECIAELADQMGTSTACVIYSSDKSHDGDFQQVRVEVPGLRAEVSAREGYAKIKG